MVARTELTPEEARFVQQMRVARLATVDEEGNPHAVPVCYAYDGAHFYTPLDEKPKRVHARQLRRVRNILVSGRAALLVDRYHDDWSCLGYVQIRGQAELREPGDEVHADAVTLLRARYSQYVTMALEDLPLIVISPQHVVSWGNLGV